MNVKKIWINRKLIWEGFLNNTWRKPKIESEATKRYIICRQCKSFDPIGTKCELKGTNPCCGECGCSLRLKLRSMESECPLGKWHAKTKEI
jgi:hypothetical protein|tara:strand:+ start:45 stop:317 length:273 start_codon:yes stop_codon:yes gene_type:complete